MQDASEGPRKSADDGLTRGMLIFRPGLEPDAQTKDNLGTRTPCQLLASGPSKRKAAGETGDGAPDSSSRSKLHDACTRVLNRSLEPGDIVYQIREEQGGQVAELTLPSLPGPCGLRSWTSNVCENRRSARLRAADLALRSLASDPELAAAVAPLTCQQSYLPGGGGSSEPALVDAGARAPWPSSAAGTVSDAKTELVIFCQWSCGRPMGRKDVRYSAARQGGQHVATVRMNCFCGEEFVGAPQANRRRAEQAAAEKALRAFEKERAQMARAAPKRRRVQTSAAACDTHPSVKQRLHDVCTRVLGHPPQAGDVVYEVAAENGGVTATLRLPCLPGELGSQVWTSRLCISRHDARLQAAAAALATVLEDPACGSMAPANDNLQSYQP